MNGQVFRAKTPAVFLLLFVLLLVGASRPALSQTGDSFTALLEPFNGQIFEAQNGVSAPVDFYASPVYVRILNAQPHSQWTVVWTMELSYTDTLGFNYHLIDYDDAGACPATTDDTGFWQHSAHNMNSVGGILLGTAQVPVGNWIARVVSRMTASPVGGGGSLDPSCEDDHLFSVVPPQPSGG
jgi:hypothetical protein